MHVLSVSGKEWPFLHLSDHSQNSPFRGHGPYNIETAIIDPRSLVEEANDQLIDWLINWLTD